MASQIAFVITLKEVGDSMISACALNVEIRSLFHKDISELTAKKLSLFA